jgi:hypothetical protein
MGHLQANLHVASTALFWRKRCGLQLGHSYCTISWPSVQGAFDSG